MDELHFFNPYSDIRPAANRLPHWQQDSAVYFITFRLTDALPESLRSEWETDRATWIRLHPEPWSSATEREYHIRFSGTIERWLDAGHGSCILRRADCAAVIAEALRYFDGDRYTQITSVVMPNHVHTLFVQNPDWPLEKLLHTGKASPHEGSTPSSSVPAACGSAIILIVSCVIKDISRIVFVTSVGIRKKLICDPGNIACMKMRLRNASSRRNRTCESTCANKERRSPERRFPYSAVENRRSLRVAAASPPKSRYVST